MVLKASTEMKIKSNLGVLIKELSQMVSLLDSLGITVNRLNFSKKSSKENKKTFDGSWYYPTRRKVNTLCNRNWPKVRDALNALQAVFVTSNPGRFNALLVLWGENQKKWAVYITFILKELSRSDESTLYQAVRDDSKRAGAITTRIKLYDDIISLRKILRDLKEDVEDAKQGFAIGSLKIHSDLGIKFASITYPKGEVMIDIIFHKEQSSELFISQLIIDISKMYGFTDLNQKYHPKKGNLISGGTQAEYKIWRTSTGKDVVNIIAENVDEHMWVIFKDSELWLGKINSKKFRQLLALYKKS